MKFRTLTYMTVIAFFAALLAPTSLTAQNQPNRPGQTHYRIISLGTLGGSASQATAIDDLGLIAGEANLTGDVDANAVLWIYGYALGLGTLGGPNSAVLWPGLNDLGQVVGISDTAMTDPLGESWSCGAFLPASHAGHTCVGFLWQFGSGMTALPTLGGNNGFATDINNRGQAVGWAENTVRDPTCNNAPPVNQYLQFEAVIWGPRPGQMQQLPPFPGDPDGAATGINDSGQVVGISGICQNAVGNQSATHALLWRNGVPTNLGNLGGTAWNTPMAINSRGDIVGFSDLTGDQGGANPNFHAFLWIQPGPMQDLQTLSGDAISEALGINNQRQVVGTSIDGNGDLHAFIWQNGQLTNLNSLIHGVSPLYLQAAQEINDSGVIVGLGCVPGNCAPTSPSVAFVAIPTYDGNNEPVPAASEPPGSSSQRAELSDSVRQQLLRRGAFGRIGTSQAQ